MPRPQQTDVVVHFDAITINLNVVGGGDGPKLDQLVALVNQLVTQGGTVMGLLDSLGAQVAQNTTVEGSAVTLIQGLAAQVADLAAKLAQGVDPAQVQADAQALSDTLKASADQLAAQVAANTPASGATRR